MSAARQPPLSLTAIYRAPLLIALASVVGLAAALLGDGVWDVVSWLGLGLPVVIVVLRGRVGANPAAPDDARRR